MTNRPSPPIAMLAELTHRCPLSCSYCSNPLELTDRTRELTTETWIDVLGQAASLGVLQLHLSGGEPASRRDLEVLVKAARDVGLYVNLITSGIGLTTARLDALEAAGLDHLQLSLQATTADKADWIGGYKGGFARKLVLAEEVRQRGIPLTVNAVMHRHTIDDVGAAIDFAATLGARRIEVACVQFYGWALANRDALLPSRIQVTQAKDTVAKARRAYAGRITIDFVPPDYYADYPKACMGGWGSTGINVTPDGTVLPCHAAATIPGLVFDRVTEKPLSAIWHDGSAFQAFRGHEWMQEPCRNCARRDQDHGGCRCQAMALAGDAAATDPVCRHAPSRPAIDEILAQQVAVSPSFVYRSNKREKTSSVNIAAR
ncbi:MULTISPECIES: pyrroloquinoline quinone biosynthesis protein PqqE [unclassified Rhizobium]|uniref:pyrroloquinoline quinone biosynthesis protein PqqE n=1 Tax=unclassified Rhizobium TaxID=2613769 RepID=UPI0007124FD4|nr:MULTISPECIES: pyrroloquinoline quinone biosynthesis protein PqqE [unclassified Rhizobium]KQS83133.1 pyrroloquinoline quinone biosynthesis protein PqqE [Rhizobium sp. Leaf386]KQS88980.1 pyrroloquinoline quinone biosynthesis protein PqqE [Rhizobium sp. Leaf391]KQT92828.1 pyrroloquinoline quinone biosynthesis protein PqqE [Rhizobium sp. Leaf453]